MILLLPQQDSVGAITRPGVVVTLIARDATGFQGVLTSLQSIGPRTEPAKPAPNHALTVVCRLARQAHRSVWRYRREGNLPMRAFCEGQRDAYLRVALMLRTPKGKV
jgi:hypothetical protein